jgi:hypothetical protein
MNRRTAAIAIVLIFGSAAAPALAQFPTSGPTEQPATFVPAAFASPYGHALIAELGRALRADADPACLNSKGIAADQLEQRGEALLIRWGTRAMETARSYVDFEVYEKNFPASAELKELREQPQIKRYLDIEQPIRLAKVLDFIFEQFDRYVLLNGIKIARRCRRQLPETMMCCVRTRLKRLRKPWTTSSKPANRPKSNGFSHYPNRPPKPRRAPSKKTRPFRRDRPHFIEVLRSILPSCASVGADRHSANAAHRRAIRGPWP